MDRDRCHINCLESTNNLLISCAWLTLGISTILVFAALILQIFLLLNLFSIFTNAVLLFFTVVSIYVASSAICLMIIYKVKRINVRRNTEVNTENNRHDRRAFFELLEYSPLRVNRCEFSSQSPTPPPPYENLPGDIRSTQPKHIYSNIYDQTRHMINSGQARAIENQSYMDMSSSTTSINSQRLLEAKTRNEISEDVAQDIRRCSIAGSMSTQCLVHVEPSRLPGQQQNVSAGFRQESVNNYENMPSKVSVLKTKSYPSGKFSSMTVSNLEKESQSARNSFTNKIDKLEYLNVCHAHQRPETESNPTNSSELSTLNSGFIENPESKSEESVSNFHGVLNFLTAQSLANKENLKEAISFLEKPSIEREKLPSITNKLGSPSTTQFNPNRREYKMRESTDDRILCNRKLQFSIYKDKENAKSSETVAEVIKNVSTSTFPKQLYFRRSEQFRNRLSVIQESTEKQDEENNFIYF